MPRSLRTAVLPPIPDGPVTGATLRQILTVVMTQILAQQDLRNDASDFASGLKQDADGKVVIGADAKIEGRDASSIPEVLQNISDDGTVEDAVFGSRAAHSVIGRSANSIGAAADIAAGSDNTFLARRSGALAFGTLVDADIPGTIARGASYQALSAKDAASGYAGLNSASRTTKGVIAADDLIVTDATKGLVLKDAAGTPHYWRFTVTTMGGLTVTDLGTSAP